MPAIREHSRLRFFDRSILHSDGRGGRLPPALLRASTGTGVGFVGFLALFLVLGYMGCSGPGALKWCFCVCCGSVAEGFGLWAQGMQPKGFLRARILVSSKGFRYQTSLNTYP